MHKLTKHLVSNRCEAFGHPLEAYPYFAADAQSRKTMEMNHAAFAQVGRAVPHNTCTAAAGLGSKHRQGRMYK